MILRIAHHVAAFVLGLVIVATAQAQEIQRGTVKQIDIAKRLVIVAVNGRDVEMMLSDTLQVPGKSGGDLAQRLDGIRPGVGVFFMAEPRDDKRIVVGMKIADGGREGTQAQRPSPVPAPGPGAQPAPAGDGPRPGLVLGVDLSARTVTVLVDKKELVLHASERTEFRGIQGTTLEERLKGFEPGSRVMFIGLLKGGRHELAGIASVGNANAPGGGGAEIPVSPDHSSLKPLDELGGGRYRGEVGGFYPDGRNTRPEAHEAAGLRLAESIEPLDGAGRPSSSGKIVLLSVGMSNTFQSSQGFVEALAGYDGKNPRLLFVNGAQGGYTAAAIQNPDDGAAGTQHWTSLEWRIRQAGATAAQVQVVWIKHADAGPQEGFPGYARKLQAELTRILQIIKQRYPNVRLAYLSSRTYGGYAIQHLNPEPYAYESGFAVKWLIEDQIKGNPSLNFDPARGEVVSPWVSWGPYLWANGKARRKADGLYWERDDFRNDDGTHQSESGQRKVGRLMLEFFRNDSTSRRWFNRP